MAGLNESTGMDLGLNGRVAIVAAASKGLGRAVAEELAREGAHVAICARTPATLPRPLRTYANPRAAKFSIRRSMSRIPLELLRSFPRLKPALAGSIFVSPIPVVLRPTLLRAPSQKTGAPRWTNC